jgi:pre-mRNA-processing factor 40
MDPQGRTYYFNQNTKESRWEKPQITTTLAQKALDASPWKEYTDEESDSKYYYNVESLETIWEMPEEYKVLLDRGFLNCLWYRFLELLMF